MPKINKPMFDAMIYHLCLIFEASQTSGHRTTKRNAKVGGNPKSRHLVGMGADLVPDSNANRAPLIAAARRLGLDAVDEGDHIHLEADDRTD